MQTFGLKVNVENTKAVWLGRERFSKDILPQKNLAWVSNEPFDILGITFFAETPCTAEHNYKKKASFRLMVVETSEHHWQNTGNQVTLSI